MNIHTQKNLRPWLVPVTLLAILAGVFVARTASSILTGWSIDR